MLALQRQALLACDSGCLEQLAQELGRQGWQWLRQPMQQLQPDCWPPVGLIELRTSDQFAQLQPHSLQLQRGYYMAMTDKQSLRCDKIKHLIAHSFRDYFTLPCPASRLATPLGHALGMSALSAAPKTSTPLLQGNSQIMQDIRARIARYAQTDMPVLLQGESGTGKECAARMIHNASSRRRSPFVAINCAAIPETLFVAELFGHDKGAFTGAGQARRGRVADASNGTLFLDEIGDMEPASQTAVLRFLESGHYSPLGSNRELHSRSRIICASNRPLQDDVAAGRFRLDLFHRINVLSLKMPPLREHPEDLAQLAHVMLAQLPGQPRLSSAALFCLQQQSFPGNVRELFNCLQQAAVLCDDGLITAAHLGIETTARPATESPLTLKAFREQKEREYLRQQLQQGNDDMSSLADKLGISRSSLYRLLEKYRLQPHPH